MSDSLSIPKMVNPKENLKKQLNKYGKYSDKGYFNKVNCIYHPITFLDDCLSCKERCTFLQQTIGSEAEKKVSKETRDKFMSYLMGKKNPIIKMIEESEVNVFLSLKLDDPMRRPLNISYLSNLTPEQEKKHWRIFYKGYMAYRGVGCFSSAGFQMLHIPEDVQRTIKYWQVHSSVMGGRYTPDQVLDNWKDELRDTDDSFNEIDFSDLDEAVEFFLINLDKVVELSLKDGEKEDDIREKIIEKVKNTILKNKKE